MSNKTRLMMILGFVLSGGLLAYLISQLEWAKFAAEISRVQWKYIPVLIAIYLLSMWVRAWRWKYLLPTGLGLSSMKLFSACNLGVLASVVLPLRAGEIARPWVLSRSKKVSFSMAFSSVVTERVFDVLAMLTLFVFALSGIQDPPASAKVAAGGLGMIAGAIVLVMFVSYLQAGLVLRVGDAVIGALLEKRAPALALKLKEMVREFIGGLRAISSFWQLLIVLFWSYFLWLLMSFSYFLGLKAMGGEATFAMGNAVNVFVALAVAIPSAPGFLGTFQWGCVAALTYVYHLPEEFAVAYSVIMHTTQMVCGIVLGALMLPYEGMKFSELRKRSDLNPPAGALAEPAL